VAARMRRPRRGRAEGWTAVGLGFGSEEEWRGGGRELVGRGSSPSSGPVDSVRRVLGPGCWAVKLWGNGRVERRAGSLVGLCRPVSSPPPGHHSREIRKEIRKSYTPSLGRWEGSINLTLFAISLFPTCSLGWLARFSHVVPARW
jgi:hypothetical protein